MKRFGDIKASVRDLIKQAKQKSIKDLDDQLSVAQYIGKEIEESKKMFSFALENGSEEQKFILAFTFKKQGASYRTSLKEGRNDINRPEVCFKR